MTDGLDLLAAWAMFAILVGLLVGVVLRSTHTDPLAEARRDLSDDDGEPGGEHGGDDAGIP